MDAGENAPQAWSVLTALRERDARVPAAVILERDQLERYPWHEVADELVYPGAPAAELRVRLAMLRRRAGAGDGTVIRLGALAIDTETYRVTASGPAARPHVQGVRAPPIPRAASRPRLHPALAAPRGVGLRLLRRHANRRRPRPASPIEARSRARAPDRDGAERRLPGGRAGRLRASGATTGSTRGGPGEAFRPERRGRPSHGTSGGNDSAGPCAERPSPPMMRDTTRAGREPAQSPPLGTPHPLGRGSRSARSPGRRPRRLTPPAVAGPGHVHAELTPGKQRARGRHLPWARRDKPPSSRPAQGVHRT